jgi:hypothetical protein
MMNFLPYSIRRPFYYMYDLIMSSDFRNEEFGRLFNADEYYQATQILGFVNYLGMTGQLDLNENFDLFADVASLQQAIEKWEDYKDLMNTSILTQ